MKFDSKPFQSEFINVLSFWEANWRGGDATMILKEMSLDLQANKEANSSAMYLSRMLYGSSVACKTLKTERYLNIADACYKELQEKFLNPKGGYFWAKDSIGHILHSPDNVNLGQAFVLYGLSEYASLKMEGQIDKVASNQAAFLHQKIKDNENGGYSDGFDVDWNPLDNQTKAFGTHLHMLEAYTKWYEYSKEEKYLPLIQDLIRIVIDHFITKDTYDCIHRLSFDWQLLPNDVWAGHNAECSWILCNSASVLGDRLLVEECKELALKMMDRVIELAIDKETGAVYNVLVNDKPAETDIHWWPPAETVIGLINAYQISGDEKYLELAYKTQGFISTKLISPSGEWYAAVLADGTVVESEPLIHFWKAMYHNVRYYVEVQKRFSNIN